MSVVQTFTERAQATQIIYQTLIQGFSRNQVVVTKGISAADAELMHRLSTSVVKLTSADVDERKTAWEEIRSTSDLALQFFSVLPSQPTAGVSGGTDNKTIGVPE